MTSRNCDLHQHEDTSIDRVLHSIASPPLPANLQVRILLAVEQRAATAPARASLRTWRFVLAIPAAAALLLAVLLHPHGVAPPARVSATPSSAALAAAPTLQPRFPSQSEAQGRDSRMLPVNRPSLPLPLKEVAALSPEAPAQLASFPAPEAPLTEQEKLLLRVAHHTNRDFDPLTPDALEREIAENKAEFDHFFPPPPPPELTPLTPPTTQEIPNEVDPLRR